MLQHLITSLPDPQLLTCRRPLTRPRLCRSSPTYTIPTFNRKYLTVSPWLTCSRIT
jgi:hypothetical protein